MTGLSRTVAEIIGGKLDYDEEKKQVLAYGAFAIMQVFLSIILVALAGVIFNVLLEALIISLTSAILRKYSGGAHSSTPTGCIVIGTFVTTALAIAINRLLPMTGTTFMTVYAVACIIFSIAAIHTHAPVDNPKKPIKKEERKMKLRKRSIIFAAVVSAVSVVLLVSHMLSGHIEWLRSVSFAMVTGMAWQSFTLLKPGHWIISRFDAFVSILIKPLGGERK